MSIGPYVLAAPGTIDVAGSIHVPTGCAGSDHSTVAIVARVHLEAVPDVPTVIPGTLMKNLRYACGEAKPPTKATKEVPDSITLKPYVRDIIFFGQGRNSVCMLLLEIQLLWAELCSVH